MNVSNVEFHKRLTSALSEENGCVVLINGEWGVGKTFFWNTYSKNVLKDKQVAYVSLFGKNNINEVQSEALIQIFKRNKYIGLINKMIDSIKSEIKVITGGEYNFNFGIAGNTLNIILSLLKAKELKNCYICIDDFERKGDSLKTVEVIGYASILSERFGCKVILIMDENKLMSGDDGVIYKEYKEKMIDFEIKYCPSQTETVKSILSSTKDRYKNGILEAVTFAQINNLRTIKRIARWAELLDSRLQSGFSDDFYYDLGFRISLLIVIYYEYGYDGLHKLSRRIINNKKDGEDDDEQLTKLNFRIQHRVSSYSELDTILLNFLDTFDLSHDNVLQIFIDTNKKTEKYKVKESAYDLLNKYTLDLTYSDSQYVLDLTAILEKNKNEIIEIFTLDDFLFILDSLIEVSKDLSTFDTLKSEALLSYANKRLDSIKSIDDLNKEKRNETLKSIIEQYPAFKIKFQEKINLLERKLTNPSNIELLLKKLTTGIGWNQDDESFLNSISNTILENSILDNKNFLESLVEFMRWRKQFKDSASFTEFYDKANDTLKKLGEERLGSFRYNRLARILNIS